MSDSRGCHARMPNTIKFHNQDLEIKHNLNFGQVRRIQKSMGDLLYLNESIKNATEDQIKKIAEDGIKASDEQMDLVKTTLMSCFEYDENKVDSMDFLDAVVLFNEVFQASTQVKKNLDQPYG